MAKLSAGSPPLAGGAVRFTNRSTQRISWKEIALWRLVARPSSAEPPICIVLEVV